MYIDIAGADEYLTSRHLDLSSWTALSTMEKTVLLNQAFDIIESQIYSGYPLYENAFPRYIPYGVEMIGVPDEIGYAQAELAFSLISLDDTQTRQLQGVSSYSIGHLSETLKGNMNEVKIVSPKAFNILKKYQGAVRII